MTEALIRTVDALEERGSLTLEEVEGALGRSVGDEIATGLLLIDHRVRADGTPVTLCRLNRRHPEVQRLTAW